MIQELCDDSLLVKQSAQRIEGGSIPTSSLQKTPKCRLLTQKEVDEMLSNWHYLGPVKFIKFALGHSEGCCVFANCRSRIYEQKNPGAIELIRMVGKPNHKWAMTSMMAYGAKVCRKRGYTKIITYADPWNGNIGTVYRAAGYKYCGTTGADTVYLLDGKRRSRRSFYNIHGTQSKEKMKLIYGDRLTFEYAPPKPTFVLDLI